MITTNMKSNTNKIFAASLTVLMLCSSSAFSQVMYGFSSTGTDYTLPSGHYEFNGNPGYSVYGVYDSYGMTGGVGDDFSIKVTGSNADVGGGYFFSGMSSSDNFALGNIRGSFQAVGSGSGNVRGLYFYWAGSNVNVSAYVKATKLADSTGDAVGIFLNSSEYLHLSGTVEAVNLSANSSSNAVAFMTHGEAGIFLENARLTANAVNKNAVAIYADDTLQIDGSGINYIEGAVVSSSARSIRFNSGKYVFNTFANPFGVSNSGFAGRQGSNGGSIIIGSGVEAEFMGVHAIAGMGSTISTVFESGSSIVLRANSSKEYGFIYMMDGGNLTIENDVVLTVFLEDGFTAKSSDEMLFAQGDLSTIVGSFSDIVLIDGEGNTYSSRYDFKIAIGGTHIKFERDINVIPEPSTYAAIFGALVLALAVYRRRK